MIAEGTSDELKDRVGGERLEVELEDVGDAEQAVEALASICQDPPSVEGNRVLVPVRHRSGVIADAVLRLNGAGVGVDDIVVHRPTLDDVFLALTGHRAEEEADEDAAAEEVAA